jgi:hypothetical protein
MMLGRAMAALCVAVLTCAGAAGGAAQVFELPERGTLLVNIPDGWATQMQQPPRQLPPSIFVKPHDETGSGLLLTVVWPIAPATQLPDDDTMRSQVTASAEKLAPQSVEGTLKVLELKGSSGRGYYFVATDRAPKPGEFKYLAQGLVRVGDIALAFTILSNDGQDALVTAALETVRTASFRPLHRP